jgi:hypothetical protein
MRIRFHFQLVIVTLVLIWVFGQQGSSAQTQSSASAHGSITIRAFSCNLATFPATCTNGGSGARVSFSFTGEGTLPAVMATGTASADYPDTGLRVQFLTGTATIVPDQHLLSVTGTCETTNAEGQIVLFGTGPCFLSAIDNTPNGATDFVDFFVFGPDGFINAFGEPASGNVSIE